MQILTMCAQATAAKKALQKFRRQLNGESGCLATTNAQLKRENEELRALLPEVEAPKRLVSPRRNNSRPSSQPPASPSVASKPAGKILRASSGSGRAEEFNRRKRELLQLRQEFNEQKAMAEEARAQAMGPKKAGEPAPARATIDPSDTKAVKAEAVRRERERQKREALKEKEQQELRAAKEEAVRREKVRPALLHTLSIVGFLMFAVALGVPCVAGSAGKGWQKLRKHCAHENAFTITHDVKATRKTQRALAAATATAAANGRW